MQTEGDGARGSIVVGQANQITAAMRDGVNFVDDFCLLRHLSEQAHGGEDSLAAGLEQNAGADGTDMLGLFEEIDFVAGPASEKGKACSGDSATDNADVQPVSHC